MVINFKELSNCDNSVFAQVINDSINFMVWDLREIAIFKSKNTIEISVVVDSKKYPPVHKAKAKAIIDSNNTLIINSECSDSRPIFCLKELHSQLSAVSGNGEKESQDEEIENC